MATRSVYKNGQPYEVWADGSYTRYADDGSVEETRPLTSDEEAALAAADYQNATSNNDVTIRGRARQAIQNNRTFVGLASPTAAQNAAQIKALTRQMNGLIRLVLQETDETD